jgi:hypothetical protein
MNKMNVEYSTKVSPNFTKYRVVCASNMFGWIKHLCMRARHMPINLQLPNIYVARFPEHCQVPKRNVTKVCAREHDGQSWREARRPSGRLETVDGAFHPPQLTAFLDHTPHNSQRMRRNLSASLIGSYSCHFRLLHASKLPHHRVRS